MTTREFYARRRRRLAQKMERLERSEQRALAREARHDASIARDLAGVPGHFAHGLNGYKLFWMFFICCFLGVVIETVFCFVKEGRLMQRTGLVWGPFNLIYGVGAVLLTVCLRPFIGRSDRWIFLGGAVIGGAFEYLCSWLQEAVLGTVSWDYSDYPFNLHGRINLLYCLFWGVLALVWVKELYPRLNGFIERNVSKTYGVALTWVLVAFMLANSLTSGAAVLRQAQRSEGVPATSTWQRVMDDAYPDERLAKIFPSMVRTDGM